MRCRAHKGGDISTYIAYTLRSRIALPQTPALLPVCFSGDSKCDQGSDVYFDLSPQEPSSQHAGFEFAVQVLELTVAGVKGLPDHYQRSALSNKDSTLG